MYFKTYLLCIFLVALAIASRGEDDDDASAAEASELLTLTVEHRFRDKWIQKHTSVYKSDGTKSVSQDQNGVQESELEEFKSLLGNNGLYRIKVTATSAGEKATYVTAAIPSVRMMRDASIKRPYFHAFRGMKLQYCTSLIELRSLFWYLT
jgi:hypothetical protein